MPEALRVAVQMDPIESINIDTDSTFVLMLEAQARGHQLWHYEVRHLSLSGSRTVSARGRPVTLRREKGNHVTAGAFERIDLGTMDVVLMRQDPPFDMAYITATHLLEHIHPRTLVVNDPASVRNAPEKLLVTQLPGADAADAGHLGSRRDRSPSARNIATSSSSRCSAMAAPACSASSEDDENFGCAAGDAFRAARREPLMIQRYEPAVRRRATSASSWSTASRWARSTACRPQGDARSNMHARRPRRGQRS